MTHDEAQQELKRVLREQQTVSVPKLKRLLETMNISLKKNNRDREIAYLRNEIKKYRRKRA